MYKTILMVVWVLLLLMLLVGVFCFARGGVLLHRHHEKETPERTDKKASTFITIGVVFIIFVFFILMMIVDWSVSVKLGVIYAGSALPLLWAAYYSRASLLYGRKEEPVALSLGILGTMIAVFGSEPIFHSFHVPAWFSLLYGMGIFFLVTLITILLNMHWQKLHRQRRSLNELDSETMNHDEKEKEDERIVLKWLLTLTGCLIIAAGLPTVLFYRGVSLLWDAIATSSLSLVLIFWGEYNLRAHLLYGYEKKPGVGWAIFLGILLVYFSLFIYTSGIFDISIYGIISSFFTYLAWEGQRRLSRRWDKRGEQRRNVIHPGTDLNEMLEREMNVSE